MIKRWCLLVGPGLVWVAANAQGADVTWNTNSGGAYTNTANWTDLSNASHHVPASTDRAIFNRNLNIAYGITFPGRPIVSPLTREVRQLSVGTNAVSLSDDVDFDELPASFVVDSGNVLGSSAMIVGDTAGQVGTLTTTLASFSAGSATLGNAAGSTGTLNVSGGTFSITGSRDPGIEFMIGQSGNGALNISNGADVGGGPSMMLGVSAGSVGAATLTGAGSTLTALDLTIGNAGNGALTVSSGGAVTANGTLSVANANSSATVTGSGSSITGSGLEVHRGSLTIQNGGQVSSTNGSVTGANTNIGTVDVGGTGSSWNVASFLFIGYGGYGTLNIHDGGQVTAPGLSSIGHFVPPLNPGTGVVNVDGLGSSFSANVLYVGNAGTGTLSVTNGATVTVANQLTVNQLGTVKGNGTVVADVINGGALAPGTSPGSLHVTGNYTQQIGGNLNIDLGGTNPGVTYDQLLVTGAIAAGGTLNVTRVDLGGGLFAPQAGDSFNIFDFGSLSGTFGTVNLPTLSSNLTWNTSQLYTTGVLSVAAAGIPGDYNNNGTVDAGDYVLYRKYAGTTHALPNDPTGGTIGTAQYTTWRSNFGKPPGSGLGLGDLANAVPEPASAALCLFAVVTSLAASSRRRMCR
jgi:T5SS/PEP-CTERM-associated repeat protein